MQLICSAWSRRIESRNDIRLKNALRYNLFSHLMFSRWNGRDGLHSGDMVNRLEEDVRLVSETVSTVVSSILITGFQLIAAFVFLLYLDSRLAWIIVLLNGGLID